MVTQTPIKISKGGTHVTGIRIRVESRMPVARHVFWSRLTTVASLRFVCKPWIYFRYCGKRPLNDRWHEGETFPFFLWLFKVVPLGYHSIQLEKIDPAHYAIQSRERGSVVTTWDHLITLQEIAPNETHYADEVDLYAGWLTPVVAWWSTRFYEHRQRRWRTLLRQLAALQASDTSKVS
jgi:hypothetical protein